MDFFDGTDPISIKLAVDALVARYVDYCDTHDWAALVDLFEADGVFDTGDVYGRVMTGPEELRPSTRLRWCPLRITPPAST